MDATSAKMSLLATGWSPATPASSRTALSLMKRSVPHFNYVGDSILGYKAHLGAGAILSNVKLDHTPISVVRADGNVCDDRIEKVRGHCGRLRRARLQQRLVSRFDHRAKIHRLSRNRNGAAFLARTRSRRFGNRLKLLRGGSSRFRAESLACRVKTTIARSNFAQMRQRLFFPLPLFRNCRRIAVLSHEVAI